MDETSHYWLLNSFIFLLTSFAKENRKRKRQIKAFLQLFVLDYHESDYILINIESKIESTKSRGEGWGRVTLIYKLYKYVPL